MDRFQAAERRRKLRQRAVDLLGGRCTICQYSGAPEAFDFHHVNPMEKDFDISSKMTSWKAIEKELSKCALLCCRCHREVHAGYHSNFIEHPDTDRNFY
jgi:hypothetical protein